MSNFGHKDNTIINEIAAIGTLLVCKPILPQVLEDFFARQSVRRSNTLCGISPTSNEVLRKKDRNDVMILDITNH